MLTNRNQSVPRDEPCPGLEGWKTCRYICFGEEETDSKIERVCIGNYTSCERYKEYRHELDKSTELRTLEDDLFSRLNTKEGGN